MYKMNKNLTNRAIAKEVAIDLESSDALNYYLAQLRETPLLSKEQEAQVYERYQFYHLPHYWILLYTKYC